LRPRHSCCRHSNTRTPARDELPANQVVAAEPAPPSCELFRGVPTCPRVYATSSFPIANTARGRERSLDPDRWHADKAARSVLILRGPRKRMKDHAPARKPDKPRHSPSAFASSAISPRETTSLAAHLQFRVRDRSGSRKRT